MSIDFPNGTDNDVDVGNDTSLQITGAFTVMCWVISDLSQNEDIVSKQKAVDRGFSLQTDDDGEGGTYSKFVIALNSSDTKSSGWPSVKLIDGKFHHICGQFVPSTAVQIWQDGILESEDTTSVPATMYDPNNNVVIGGRPESIGNFDGKIEDVRIYTRNFSAAEIMAIFASRGRDNFLDGLVSRWPLNEKHEGATVSGSNSVKDIGPSGNHGTPVGSLTYYGSRLSYSKMIA